jgi:hypothetical protein
MAVSLFIIIVSFALCIYWLRYTVILILRTRPTTEYAQQVAAANHLSFVEVRKKLHAPAQAAELNSLCTALERDYRALKYLLGHAATAEAGSYTAEQHLLMINFRLMKLWFTAISRFRPQSAKVALLEMSGTLEYFANAMGRRFASLAGQAGQAAQA